MDQPTANAATLDQSVVDLEAQANAVAATHGGWSGNTHYGSQMCAFKDGYTGFPAYKNPVLPGNYASAAYAPIQLMDADLSNVPVDQEITYVQLGNLYRSLIGLIT